MGCGRKPPLVGRAIASFHWGTSTTWVPSRKAIVKIVALPATILKVLQRRTGAIHITPAIVLVARKAASAMRGGGGGGLKGGKDSGDTHLGLGVLED